VFERIRTTSQWRGLQRFARAESAGVALTFAVAFPVLATIGAGAVDLAAVHNSKAKLQAAVDATAVEGAKQLSMTSAEGLQARAEQFIGYQLATEAGSFTYRVSTGVGGENDAEFTVTAQANRPSFFANLLPPGGWNFGASATAQRLNQLPLCVLVTGTMKADELAMRDQATMSAPGCAVHSNGDIKVENNAMLLAGAVGTSGLSSGAVAPAAQIGSPQIEDPFGGMRMGSGGGLLGVGLPGDLCVPLDTLVSAGLQVLPPGLHCGPINVEKNATLTLLPGEHYFRKGKLDMKDSARIVGADVVLVFDKEADFKFKDNVQVELEGRKSGPFAGFVIATTQANDHTFEISSTAARKLLGTIYIPSAILQVTGGKTPVANESAWTVIVAKSIKMQGAPNLVINANYAGSSVPVPKGVGPGDAAVRLTR